MVVNRHLPMHGVRVGVERAGEGGDRGFVEQVESNRDGVRPSLQSGSTGLGLGGRVWTSKRV